MKSKRIVRGRYQSTSKKWTGTKPNIEIVYEDNHLLIIDKPTGLLSQADKTKHVDVTYLCKRYLKKEYNKPRECLFRFNTPARPACKRTYGSR